MILIIKVKKKRQQQQQKKKKKKKKASYEITELHTHTYLSANNATHLIMYARNANVRQSQPLHKGLIS